LEQAGKRMQRKKKALETTGKEIRDLACLMGFSEIVTGIWLGFYFRNKQITLMM